MTGAACRSAATVIELPPELRKRIDDAMWSYLKAAQDADDVPMGGAYVDPSMDMIDSTGAGISLWPCAQAVIDTLELSIEERHLQYDFRLVSPFFPQEQAQ